MKNKFYILFYLVFFIPSISFSQSNYYSGDSIARRFEDLSEKAPIEIAYIQTNKDIFETGEDLWFKVYLLNSHILSPSLFSKTLYLQLVKEKTKNPIWQEKYEIKDGFSDGRILLREDMEEGNYLIEAFTAGSFFADSSEFTAIKRIKVVKDITHLRYIRAEFEKQTFENTDSIKIKIIPVSQNDTSTLDITVNLKQDEDVQNILQTTMALNEEKKLTFKPQSIKKGSQIVIDSKYKDHSEELILPIPCATNPVQFNVFPEGGSLISGIKSRIAFKAVNINGEPVDVNGILYKNDSAEINFRSIHDGMGSFDITPDKNAKYYIRLDKSLTDSIYSFPDIEPEGLSLRLLSRDKESLNFLISRKTYGSPENIYLLVQIRGVIYGFTEAKLDKKLKIKVPLAEMPQGIAEVTLFDSEIKPVAERLIYVNPEKKLKIQTIISDSIVPTRGKVDLKIITTDENNNPIRANLGLTVFDKIYENQSDSTNILTHIYLSTQLKGRIYNPGYYFNEKNINRESDIDLLLMTQGWRRYVWSELNLKKINKSDTEIISDGIRGQAYRHKFGKKNITGQILIMAFSPENDSTKIIFHSDSIGQFTIDNNRLNNWKNNIWYLKPYGQKGSQIALSLENPFDSINYTFKYIPISYPISNLKNSFSESSVYQFTRPGMVVIKEVSITGQKSKFKRGKFLGSLDSLSKIIFYTNPTYSEHWVCKNNIWDCPNHSRYDPGSTIPIEGKKYRDINGHVHVAIYNRPKQDLSEEELLKQFNLYKVKSFYVNKEFYQPDYDKELGSLSIPDFRNTLIWAPVIETDEKGEANVSFFCSDLNTDFVGRIEGIGEKNLLGSENFKFTVRKLSINSK